MWCFPGRKAAKRNRDLDNPMFEVARAVPGLPLFHVKPDYWSRAARHGGFDLDDTQLSALHRFGVWLGGEATIAGGIGPGETDRIDTRHIADSLLFAVPWETRPQLVWDWGSGVGLPGIPLAVAFPDTEFHLIDRSGRRVDLMRRAVRVVGVDNVVVIQEDFTRMTGNPDVVVSRAATTPNQAGDMLSRRLNPGAMAVFGGSWTAEPQVAGWETLLIPPKVLDHAVWLLIMRRQ